MTVPFPGPGAVQRSLACLLVATLAACGSTPPSAPPTAPEPTATTTAAPPIKIGIALGGGAAKGFAHIGVLKMLEANGFAPAVVAGTSAGSVVGAMYASGMNAFELQEKAVALDEARSATCSGPRAAWCWARSWRTM